MASLDSLPAPLPFHILRQVHDIKALDAARRSCSMFAAVFEKHAVELLEHLMVTTLLDEVTIQMRLYVMLLDAPWSGAMQDQNVDHLHEKARQPLARTVGLRAVVQALRDFTNLASVSDELLYRKLQYLQHLPHQHLKDKFFRYPRGCGVNHPQGTQYSIPKLSPPCWLDQQRVLCALWVQHNHVRFGILFDDWQSDYRADLLKEVQLSTKDLQTTMKHSSARRGGGWAALATRPKLRDDSTPGDIAWGEDLEFITWGAFRGSGGYGFFHRCCRRRPDSPLRYADWHVLRRLGLGIWSRRRMAKELELLHYPVTVKPPTEGSAFRIGIDDRLSTHDQFFTWHSLYLAASKPAIANDKKPEIAPTRMSAVSADDTVT